MAYTDWNEFRIEHCYSQQVSFASLLDDRGLFAFPPVVLEADGHDHADAIFKKIEDWLIEREASQPYPRDVTDPAKLTLVELLQDEVRASGEAADAEIRLLQEAV